jgi:SAM-dependent methyltransferase
MPFDAIFGRVAGYYGEKVRAHGNTARGVDWNSEASQELRFRQLLSLCDSSTSFSLLDIGCGYGALFDFLMAQKVAVDYRGFDIAPEMVSAARSRHPNACFTSDRAAVESADYSVASGIFNVRLQTSEAEWKDYVAHTLDDMSSLGRRGFAFNMLTSYSDADKMRDYLYYPDPCFYFDLCKRKYSRNVALLHDYDLYEFTVLVRK